MTGLMKKVRNWFHDDRGVTSVEYAVMLALILVALFSTINAVGGTALDYFKHDLDEISNAVKF